MKERLLELAKRVRRGVKLLDRKIPNWRRTIREHADEFDFADGACCVLGTLEHYNGRMRVLKARKGVTEREFTGATEALGIDSEALGFDGTPTHHQESAGDTYDQDIAILDSLWRAEIGL